MKGIIKSRWKFYLCGYFFGYLYSVINSTESGVKQYFPIKLFGIAMMLLFGTAIYYGVNEIHPFDAMRRSLKYIIIFIVLLLVVKYLSVLVSDKFTFDIMPYIGTNFK